MNNGLYGRRCRILVADKDNKGWDLSALRCVFNIEKVGASVANFAEIAIYNMTYELEHKITEEGTRVIVEAGYEGFVNATNDQKTESKTYGKIFDGEIVQFIREKEANVDYVFKIICMDGDAFLNKSILNFTLAAGVSQRQVLEEIASRSSNPAKIGHISENISEQKLPRGKVFFGQPKKYLQDIARNNAAEFWIDDGEIYLEKATDEAPGEIIVLTPKTGLIGTPEQVPAGITFICLLNPNIRLKSLVQINNSMIRQQKLQKGLLPTPLDQDGTYQVYQLWHIGDTRGNEWYTKVIGVSRAGKGALLGMLANKDQNPN